MDRAQMHMHLLTESSFNKYIECAVPVTAIHFCLSILISWMYFTRSYVVLCEFDCHNLCHGGNIGTDNSSMNKNSFDWNRHSYCYQQSQVIFPRCLSPNVAMHNHMETILQLLLYIWTTHYWHDCTESLCRGLVMPYGDIDLGQHWIR